MPKGSKRPRGFSVSHQRGESKPMLKGGQRATWVFSKPPKRGIKTNSKRGQRATWVFSEPPKRGIKTNAKRGQRATWVVNKPPAMGDQYLMPNLS